MCPATTAVGINLGVFLYCSAAIISGFSEFFSNQPGRVCFAFPIRHRAEGCAFQWQSQSLSRCWLHSGRTRIDSMTSGRCPRDGFRAVAGLLSSIVSNVGRERWEDARAPRYKEHGAQCLLLRPSAFWVQTLRASGGTPEKALPLVTAFCRLSS